MDTPDNLCFDLEEEMGGVEEVKGIHPNEKAKLNFLLDIFMKYHGSCHEKDHVRKMLLHRRMANSLLMEVFPLDSKKISHNFVYNEQLTAGEALKGPYHYNENFNMIAVCALYMTEGNPQYLDMVTVRRTVREKFSILFPKYLIFSN